jgi:thioredoxin 1
MAHHLFSQISDGLQSQANVVRRACCATVAVVSLQLLAGGCAPSNLVEIRDANELQRVISSSKQPVLVDFYKAGCETCNAFEITLRALAEDHKGRITVLKFLLKRANGVSTAPDFAEEHDILMYPTVIIYMNGQEQKRFVQQYMYDDYKAAINEYLAAPTTRPVTTYPSTTQAATTRTAAMHPAATPAEPSNRSTNEAENNR